MKKLSEQADPYRLYELAVQSPEAEVEFISQTFAEIRGRPGLSLREDFCGSAQICRQWLQSDPKRSAIGIDRDERILKWGQMRFNNPRMQWIQSDVLNAYTDSVDIIAAMNFSYWLLTERKRLKHYFERAYLGLVEDGLLFLDAYGGYDSFRTIEEKRSINTPWGKVEYIWDQYFFNPIDHRLHCAIHFQFEDGSRLDKAFDYHWRLWTLPELSDLLKECGFEPVIYWQGWDEEGEPDGEFKPARQADDDAGWIAYIVAKK